MNTKPTHPLLRFTAMLVVATMLAFSPGCFLVAVGAAGAAGAGAVAYVRGELDATVSGNVETVEKATSRALEQLQFVKINEGKSTVDAIITARTGQDRKITIRLDRSSDNLTRLRIRVDTFGDESLSRLLYDNIKTNL